MPAPALPGPTSASVDSRGLIEQFPELFGDVRLPTRVIAARHSRIDEFAGRGNQPPVIVKTITVSVSPEHAARVAGREFEALTWLHARVSPDLRETIPEPLAWIPGTPALAMRKLGGVTVASFLRRHGTRLSLWGGAKVGAVGDRIGRWLRRMHEATRGPDGVFEGAGLLNDIERSLLRASRSGMAEGDVTRVRQLASAAIDRLAGARVPCAARQGDFTVSNILLDGERVRMVDFENFAERDAIYEDIASFAAYLRMLHRSVLYSPRHLERLRRAFLDAYGQLDGDAVLGVYEVKHALAVLAQFPGGATSRGRRRRAALEREIVSLAQRLNGGTGPRRGSHDGGASR